MRCAQVQPGYILYNKPFRDTSLLVEVFSLDYGRISLVAKGARGALNKDNTARRRRLPFQGLLQPFVPLVLSWRGKTDLLNLTAAEANGSPPLLDGRALFSGWYLNELVSRTLSHFDVHSSLFEAYQLALYGLVDQPQLSLRQFEKTLLTVLGVLPQLDREIKTNRLVKPGQWYTFSPDQGVSLQPVFAQDEALHANSFLGEVLLAVQSNNWQHLEYLPAIKRLFKIILDHLLDGARIRSRDLFSGLIKQD